MSLDPFTSRTFSRRGDSPRWGQPANFREPGRSVDRELGGFVAGSQAGSNLRISAYEKAAASRTRLRISRAPEILIGDSKFWVDIFSIVYYCDHYFFYILTAPLPSEESGQLYRLSILNNLLVRLLRQTISSHQAASNLTRATFSGFWTQERSSTG